MADPLQLWDEIYLGGIPTNECVRRFARRIREEALEEAKLCAASATHTVSVHPGSEPRGHDEQRPIDFRECIAEKIEVLKQKGKPSRPAQRLANESEPRR